MMKYSLILVSFLMFYACREPQAQSVQQILNQTPKEFAESMQSENVQVLDVRTPEEFAAGHLQNAVNINIYDASFAEQIKKLSPETPVYVYCKAGSRSAKAADILKQNGFRKIVNMSGGYSSWVASGLPVVH